MGWSSSSAGDDPSDDDGSLNDNYFSADETPVPADTLSPSALSSPPPSPSKPAYPPSSPPSPSKPSYLLGEPYDDAVNELRKEIARRKLKLIKTGPYKNNTKAGLIKTLRDNDANRATYAATSNSGLHDVISTRWTRHCYFRLANIMTSGAFVDRLSETHSTATRHELDVGLVQGGNSFWRDVASAWVMDEDEYGGLRSGSSYFNEINPAIIIPHSSHQLFESWKGMTADYQSAHVKWKRSGNHEDFASYTSKRHVIYLHIVMAGRSHVLTNVTARLPSQIAIDTLGNAANDSNSTGVAVNDDGTQPSRKKRARDSFEGLSAVLVEHFSRKNAASAVERLSRDETSANLLHTLKASLADVTALRASLNADCDSDGDSAIVLETVEHLKQVRLQIMAKIRRISFGVDN